LRPILAATLLALGIAIAPDASAGAPVALFGMLEFRAEAPSGLTQWDRVMAKIKREGPIYDTCAASNAGCPSRELREWQSLLTRLAGLPVMRRLDAVNRFFNRKPYRSDWEVWGRSDYWASPIEFIGRSGDCEDYVIAKYLSLRRLGMPPSALRMVVLRDTERGLAHAVLVAYLDREAFVLDNLYDDVQPQARLTHYVPYYSINEQDHWVHVARGSIVVSADRASNR
jgi:predicted transglutaminase-like cysteine proteinase